MQEVIDFRYFKITTVEDGVENMLQLRFDKYKDYKEWGIVLLEATLTNEALLKKLNQPFIEQARKSLAIEAELAHRRNLDEMSETQKMRKTHLNLYLGKFANIGRNNDLEKIVENFLAKEWHINRSMGEI